MPLRTLCLALFLLLLAAPAAHAGNVTQSGSVLTFEESDGDAGVNVVVLALVGGDTYYIQDASEMVNDLAAACSQSGNAVTCSAAGITGWQVQGGGGNDSLQVNGGNLGFGFNPIAVPAAIYGGPGDDTLVGGEADDTIVNGADMSGGLGADSFEPQTNGSIVRGQGGRDTVSYASQGTGVRVNLDQAAGGPLGDPPVDTLLTVENVTTTNFDDVIVGDLNANTILAGGGNDFVNVRDGFVDTVDCGAGTTDFATTDPGDVISSCESESEQPPAPAGPAGTSGTDGSDGADGADGAQGPAGPAGASTTGPAGPAGPGGPAGAPGPRGAPGRDATVRCVTGKPRRGRVRVTCRVTRVARAGASRLSRGGRVIARGSVRSGTLRLMRGSRLRAGTYTLTVRSLTGRVNEGADPHPLGAGCP